MYFVTHPTCCASSLNGSEELQACVLAPGVRKEGILLTVCVCVCVFFTTCSSIHDHTDAHCFMKLLQGQLKETLFQWPEGKSHGDMEQRSQRVLLENKCAYINGEETFILMHLRSNAKNKLAACHDDGRDSKLTLSRRKRQERQIWFFFCLRMQYQVSCHMAEMKMKAPISSWSCWLYCFLSLFTAFLWLNALFFSPPFLSSSFFGGAA